MFPLFLFCFYKAQSPLAKVTDILSSYFYQQNYKSSWHTQMTRSQHVARLSEVEDYVLYLQGRCREERHGQGYEDLKGRGWYVCSSLFQVLTQ